MSLEEALSLATSETNLQVEDKVDYIRNFLVEKNLLEFNSKLTFNVREKTQNNIEFVYKQIHEDFVKDSLTEKCINLIDDNLLLKELQK